ncbi:hypothetical protein B9Z65_2230 [Elsinoe australis]|uniref:2',3'-cyclic-nucleotide 3'-phosphodiesterase n=1 Tax=Elsinoe australis TaxID=40998 RepID=A0A2P7YNE2_9PEZI|nr:hypothetical protein B9Z65_2230 [Elsinoe australis]
MPGSSIWLIPPPRDPFNRTMQTQITSMVPMRFAPSKAHNFIPHVTLTSTISPALHEVDAQAWLDGLELTIEGLQALSAAKDREEADSAAAEKRALEAGNLEPATTTTTAASDPEKAAEQAAEQPEAPKGEENKASIPAKPVEVNLYELEAGEPFFKKLTLRAKKPCPGLSELAVAVRAQGCYSGDVETAKSWEKDEYLPHLSLLYADVTREEAQKKIPGVLQDLVRAKAILKPARDGTVAKGGSIVLVTTDREIQEWKPIASRQLPEVVWKWTMT